MLLRTMLTTVMIKRDQRSTTDIFVQMRWKYFLEHDDVPLPQKNKDCIKVRWQLCDGHFYIFY